MSKEILISPCSYQGAKQRLAKQIVDIFYAENEINDETIFYDLCCGSGAVSLELINRGFNPNNITMIDSGEWGGFWQSIANDEFDLKEFKEELDKMPSIENIQEYLQELSATPIKQNLRAYHYLMLQSGAFGGKQIWVEDGKWGNTSFRSYWKPTPTSNRRSPVNPMMPMPNTLYKRTEAIVKNLSGCITASKESVYDTLYRLDCEKTSNMIIYIDPPYINTTGYGDNFNVRELESRIWNDCPIYISEGYSMPMAVESILLSVGRNKGNISGDIKKKPTEEWLNRFGR